MILHTNYPLDGKKETCWLRTLWIVGRGFDFSCENSFIITVICEKRHVFISVHNVLALKCVNSSSKEEKQ